MDKFEKTSIYDLDWKMVDNDGEEVTFTFKPLPFEHYPRLYSLLGKLSEADLMSKNDDLSDEEQGKKFMEGLSKELITELIELEKAMVSNSYPEKEDIVINRFVTSNAFELMEPLMSLMNREEKVNPRKVQAVKNGLPSKD